MLIAEDLLLLLTDERSGAARVDSTKLTYALAGAVLLELSLAGRVDVAGRGESVRRDRLVVRDPAPTGDPVLDRGLAELSRRQNKRPRDVIRHLAKGVREDVYALLAARGTVRQERSKILGVFPRTRWPVVDPEPGRRSRLDLKHAVMRDQPPTDSRVAAVISLLAAIDKLPMVVTPDQTGWSKRQITRRGKEISEGSWAPKAVKDAVAAVNAAITAGVVVAASTAATSGG